MESIRQVPLEAIEAARERIAGAAIRAPLVPFDAPDVDATIWLKLECLQPIGSFKIRGASNAMALAGRDALSNGVYTASAGNMAQGVAYSARRMQVACRVIVPDGAPLTKVDAVRRLGAEVVPVPFAEWWRVLEDHGHPDESGFFVHPVSDPSVIAGNGTIGLELVDDLDRIDSVFVPFGGGGLSCGIASALAALRPDTRVFATEVETAAPLSASLTAGAPVAVDRVASFVDGIGGGGVLEEMWPLASTLLTGARVVSIDAICTAIRDLVTHAHVVAEGAGGSALAAARDHAAQHPDEVVVAVISGGNLDTAVLASILAGERP